MEDMAIINKIKSKVRAMVPLFVMDGYHFLWAMGGALRYGFPSKKIKVIGITGTNGKSTTVELLATVLKEAGYKVALSSSIKFEVANEVRKNGLGNSMPGRFALQKLLAQAVAAKCEYAIIEVTSEGIKQHRHRFIRFEGAVFTNLTPEHIESHGGFENYRNAKLKLFAAAKGFHVINRDDENAKYFLEFKPARTFYYGMCAKEVCKKPEGTDICAQEAVSSRDGVRFGVNGTEFVMGLVGEFNIYNALAAIAVAGSQGISLDICRKALARVASIPGRMERAGVTPNVFVDYAFTPNALEQAYSALQHDLAPGGRLICLLGACGGGRDKWKRPVLGQIAARYCDRIILADEDPYDEDPQKIIDMVREGAIGAGFSKDGLEVIRDRRQAIAKALSLAAPSDTVILTGKGCEAAIRYGQGKRVVWDEKAVVKEEMDRLKKG